MTAAVTAAVIDYKPAFTIYMLISVLRKPITELIITSLMVFISLAGIAWPIFKTYRKIFRVS